MNVGQEGPQIPSDAQSYGSGQCLHSMWRRCGKYSGKTGDRQRWRCVCCGKERVEGAKPPMEIHERAIALLPAFRAGKTILEASREFEMAPSTVLKAYQEIQKHISRPRKSKGTLWSRRKITVESVN